MAIQRTNSRAKHRQKGVSLIEVLIAMVLISIGLLGIFASQITSLQLTNSAYQRSLATLLANDIADRMRANIDGTATYLSTVPNGVDKGTTCINYTGALTGTCTTTFMSQQDVFDWQQSIADSLNGQGYICRDNSPNDGSAATAADAACDDLATSALVIKIWWDDDRDATTADLLFSTSMQL